MAEHDHTPDEIDMTTLDEEREFLHEGRQRSPRTDPSMRDGDSGHGNPYENATDEPTTDNDVGDEVDDEIAYSGSSGGAVGGTPAGLRSAGGTLPEGSGMTASEARGDSTIGDTTGEKMATDEAVSAAEAAPIRDFPADADATAAVAESGAEAARTDKADERTGPDDGGPPLTDFDRLTIPQVMEKAGGLSPEELRRLRDHEAAHRNRKTLLTKLDRLLSGNASRSRPTRERAADAGA